MANAIYECNSEFDHKMIDVTTETAQQKIPDWLPTSGRRLNGRNESPPQTTSKTKQKARNENRKPRTNGKMRRRRRNLAGGIEPGVEQKDKPKKQEKDEEGQKK
jgi:hypothetical protein